MQYHNNVTKQIHNILTHFYEVAKNMYLVIMCIFPNVSCTLI